MAKTKVRAKRYQTAETTKRLGVYVPMDRRHAMSGGKELSDRSHGAALFADISGFTPLSDALGRLHGPARGAEETAIHLNRTYDALIAEVHRFGGSVIGFSGDAITCWFQDDQGLSATACGLAIQQAMQRFALIPISVDESVRLSVKVAITVGSVRRFRVGDPEIQYVDTIAGATLDRLAATEQHAQKDEVVLDEETAALLAGGIQVRAWRDDGGGRYAVVASLASTPETSPWPELPFDALSDEQARPWILPSVYERLRGGQGEFIAELRPAVALFVRFGGIDYDTDDAAGNKLDAYIRWTQRVLTRYAGTLLQLTVGDKGSYLYAAFGAPVAHDDDAVRAAAAALELRRPPSDLQFISLVQIGITRGRMRTGSYGGTTRRTYGVLGNEVNLAARLMQRAEPGQILVSRRIAQSVAHRFDLNELGTAQIKGWRDTLDVFELVGPTTRPTQAVGRSQTELVGRTAERAALNQQLQALLNEKRGGIVIIEGEAGIGKSRLVEELFTQTQSAGATSLLGAGDAIERSDLYHAWRPIFSELLGLDRLPEDPEVRSAHVLSWLEADPEQAYADEADFVRLAPLLTVVLPLDLPDNDETAALTGQVRAETTRDLLARLLRRASRSSPLVLIIEDAHWLDSASWALTQRVAMLGSLLMVIVTRPLGETAPPEFQQLVAAPGTERLVLGPLMTDDTLTLVQQRLAVRSLPEPVAALIREKAEGNPFFSEELAYALRDSGLIVVSDGVCEIAPDAPDLGKLDFPDTVEGVITSRIDRLTPSQSLSIKVASVIGRIFAFRILRDIHPVHENIPLLEEDLAALTELDLTPLESPEPDLRYMFKHIITQEVAYNLLLFTQRRQLHQAVGDWYERNYPDDLAPFYPLLAYHWGNVARGEEADLATVGKALDYLHKAAEQAVQNYASVEATHHLAEALELLKQLPETPERDQQELGIQAMLAYSLMTLRGYGDSDVERAYTRAHELSEKVKESVQLGFILYGLFSFYASRAEYEPATKVADRLLDLGDRSSDSPTLSVGHQSKGISTFLSGDIETGLTHVQQSYQIADALEDSAFFQYGGDFRAYTKTWIALAQCVLGYPGQAQATFESALDMTAKQPYAHGFVLCFGGIPLLRHDTSETLRRADELAGLANKYSFLLLGIVANLYRGWVTTQTQQTEEGIALMEHSLLVLRGANLNSFLPWYLALYAEALSAVGRPDDALQTVDEAITLAERAGGNFYQAELHRLNGEILMNQGGDAENVGHHFQQAVDIARQQSARWWELRATVSLCRLLQSQGKGDDAKRMLSSLYSWFAEGFDTADLIAAKTLLDALDSNR